MKRYVGSEQVHEREHESTIRRRDYVTRPKTACSGVRIFFCVSLKDVVSNSKAPDGFYKGGHGRPGSFFSPFTPLPSPLAFSRDLPSEVAYFRVKIIMRIPDEVVDESLLHEEPFCSHFRRNKQEQLSATRKTRRKEQDVGGSLKITRKEFEDHDAVRRVPSCPLSFIRLLEVSILIHTVSGSSSMDCACFCRISGGNWRFH